MEIQIGDKFKGRCVLECFMSNEILIVRILLDLFHKLPIRESHPLLDDERTEYHPAGFCNVSCCRCEYGGILRFPSFPWQSVGTFYPFVLIIRLHSTRCIELEKAQLKVFRFRGFVHDFRPQVQAKKPINTSKWLQMPCT